ncbi:MAG: Gfo/Idh/MocA family oxidoreductase [Desulfobulbaceae bacterium]
MKAVGIIGTGRHGSRYANHLVHDIPGFRLAAVSRRSAEGELQAKQWGCRFHRNWPELVRDPAVEAVVGVVPPAMNPDIARLCSEEGKPLLLEKPLAASLRGAEEIASLCATQGLRLTVGQTLRYNQVIRRLKEELHRVGVLHSFSADQRLEPSTLDWHHDQEQAGAGVSFHTAVHVFDALRFITGLEPKRVMAVTARHSNTALEDLLLVILAMENGTLGMVDCSRVGKARSGRYEFVGSEGQLHGDQIHNRLEMIRGTDIIPLETGEPQNTIVPLLKDWRDYLAGTGPNPVPVSEGLAAVRLCEASLESARTGRWMHIG